MRALIAASVISASVSFASAPPSELTLINESTSGGKNRVVTLSLRGNKAYFEMAEEGAPPRIMLRDIEAKKMWLVNDEKKLLIVVTEEDSKALEARQEQFRAQMKAQLEKMPPEQRARMEATMLGGQADPSKPQNFTYEKKKTAARKIAGFACEDYVVKRDGQLHGEGCYATWKTVGITAEEFKNIMLKSMPSSAAAGPMMQAFEAHSSAPGLPIERIVFDANGNVTHSTTLKSFTKTALPAAKFELPKGYTEKPMAEGMMGRPPPGAPGPGAPGPNAPAPKPAPAPAKQ